ncbi:MAG: glutamine--fructose-6-phosphate transaminase (isomerizing), partial [Raoultibacter sp.]
MCGIVGYTGSEPVKDILIEGLQRLEYRGYDSAGVAIENNNNLAVVHCVGKVENLVEKTAGMDLAGTCGIGHTRWATHGRPSELNAHPHTSCDGRIAVVHNGIIENFAELRESLQANGHVFTSDTDTEVLAHLIEDSFEGDLLHAVHCATQRVIGAYGLAVVSADEPDVIIATRKDSPIVIGKGEHGTYVASDIIALIDATRDVVILGDNQFAKLMPNSIEYYKFPGERFEPEVTHVDWDVDLAEKGGYPDFMLKEINEQPRVVRDTLAGRLTGGELTIDELDLSREELNLIDRVYVIACGTSYHAGLVAKQLIEGWARIPTEVEVASEFRYRNPIITPTTLVVAVSQSGETADTLAAIRDARVRGAKVFGITNVVGSPVARESDGVIYTKANKEIAV